MWVGGCEANVIHLFDVCTRRCNYGYAVKIQGGSEYNDDSYVWGPRLNSRKSDLPAA